MPFSSGSSWPRECACVSYVSCNGRWVLYHQCHLGSPNCHKIDLKGIFHMVVSPLWRRDKVLDEQRHLYSGCYYEKYHIVNSLCSHSLYQCRRNTRSRHSEWLVKQLPLQIAASRIFLQIIPINKGSLCMSSTKSYISVHIFLTNVSRTLGIFPRRPQRHFKWKAHGYL